MLLRFMEDSKEIRESAVEGWQERQCSDSVLQTICLYLRSAKVEALVAGH
jgi:hypothetical protein